MLRGRENQHEDIAKQKIQGFIASLEEIYRLDSPVKKSGNTFTAILKLIK